MLLWVDGVWGAAQYFFPGLEYLLSVTPTDPPIPTHTHVARPSHAPRTPQAFVLYRVVDPEKAFIEVEHIEDELKREAEATILSVFGAHDSSDVYAGIRHSESAQVRKSDWDCRWL